MRHEGKAVFRSFAVRMAIHLIVCASWGGVLLPVSAYADTSYYQHSFFDNSLTPDAYYYSSGKVSAPSALTLVNGKVPVEGKTFLTPPNALRLEWQSMENGGWEAQVDVMRFRNREIRFHGGTLYFWCLSAQSVSASALPLIRIVDTAGNFSAPLKLELFAEGANVPAREWVRIKIPLDRFISASIHALDPDRLQSIVFSQSVADGIAHTLLIDEIWLDDESEMTNARSSGEQAVSTPQGLNATGYERHVDLTWERVPDENIERYVIYRSFDGKEFQPVGMQVRGIGRYTDFIGKTGQKAESFLQGGGV